MPNTHYTQLRTQIMAIDPESAAPTARVAGQTYFDYTTGKLYVYDGTFWNWSQGTTTSTSTTTTSTSSTSTSSTSSSSSSTSSTSSSSSSSSSSTSTTLL